MKYTAKRIDNDEWVEGFFTKKKIGNLIVPVIEQYKECDSGDYVQSYEVDGETLIHLSKNDNIDELLEQRNKIYDFELNDEHWDKLIGSDIEGGKKIIIVWKNLGKECPDEGYLFELPFCSADEGDIFCHFSKTQNPDGMDDGCPIWIHLYELMTNENVISITIE